MRVAFLSPVGQVGGAERVLLTLLDAWKAGGHAIDPVVIVLADGPLVGELHDRGVGVVVVPMPESLARLGDSGGSALGTLARAIGALPALWRFSALLHRRLAAVAPDIIHANGLKAHLLAAMSAPAGAKVVWHLHDFVGARRLAPFLLARVARRVSGAVAVSQAVAADFCRVLPAVSVSVVPNAVNTARFCPGPGDGAWLDGLAGMGGGAEPGTVRVGLVATYALWKGHDLFLRAAARLKAAAPVRFYMIGGPIYATGAQRSVEELRILAMALGVEARFVPLQADMPAVYRSLDVVVHASTSPEPFGLVIAEAMACGRAVVAAASGGAKDLFTDGEDALGHPMGDESALAVALERLIDSPSLRDNLGAAAALAARRRFSPGPQARAMESLYRSLMESPAGPQVPPARP